MSRWGDEKTLFFIECYREHECLWNPMAQNYKSKAARVQAYKAMLKKFNDDQLTLPLLKTKIKNIRTTYHQALNKIKSSQQSGAALVYQPNLSWFEAVDAFLGEAIHKEPVNMTPQTSRKVNHFTPKFNYSSLSDLDASPKSSPDRHLDHDQLAQPPHDANEPTPKKKIRLLTNKIRKRQDGDADAQISDAPHLVDRTLTINTATPCDDEFHFFGMNVAAQLRRLPLHTALQLQTEFQNSLYLARIHAQSSSVANGEETTTQTNEELSESESIIEHDVDEKEFPLDIENTTVLTTQSQLSPDNDVTVNMFKKAWDAS